MAHQMAMRPFLGPMYACVAAMQGRKSHAVPKALVLIMRFLAAALQDDGRVAKTGRLATRRREVFRTDARAEGEEIWLGGWALDSDEIKECRWFSERLDCRRFPWLKGGGEAYRQIAALELLATLVAVVVFGIDEGPAKYHCSAATDNKGNSHVVARLLTTKYPLCVCLMELALQLQSQGVDLRLEWLRRDLNQEADDLTNGVYGQFSLEKRLRFDLGDFEGIIFKKMMAAQVAISMVRSRHPSLRVAGAHARSRRRQMACASQILGSDTMQRQVGTNIKKENAPEARSPRWGGCLVLPPVACVGEIFNGLELAHCSYPFFCSPMIVPLQGFEKKRLQLFVFIL